MVNRAFLELHGPEDFAFFMEKEFQIVMQFNTPRNSSTSVLEESHQQWTQELRQIFKNNNVPLSENLLGDLIGWKLST